jgi:excisionase family DNA binding protein
VATLSRSTRNPPDSTKAAMALGDLSTHLEPYLSIGELAGYWHVSREYIYKLIRAGSLPAIQLGVRLFRISTPDAREFEKRALVEVKRNQSSEHQLNDQQNYASLS